MNLKFIFVFCLFRIIEAQFLEKDGIECVKRRSGTCKAFNVTRDFDSIIDLIPLQQYNGDLNTIIEFDYIENKHSYESAQNKMKKDCDTFDNPVIEMLFSDDPDPLYNYRLVLGEKLNRLAYLELVEGGRSIIKYNNYSPDLPSWPFAISVTKYLGKTYFMVHTKNGDGFDKSEPFLYVLSEMPVNFMAVRNRNKNVKIVGFYGCSTKYGENCGTEYTETIRDCREKFSPLGSGFFNTFVNMRDFNRSNKTGEFELDEYFGVYRRNNDNCVILFSHIPDETTKYIRITIGDEISVRMRGYIRSYAFSTFNKDVVMKGWNQEPSHPNFIRIKISSKTNSIAIYRIRGRALILTMDLCNYFERDREIEMFMSVTSDRFKTVNVYYDCCNYYDAAKCHVYEEDKDRSGKDAGTIRMNGTGIRRHENVKNELESVVNGGVMMKTYLDTSDFREPQSTKYFYDEKLSESDDCRYPHY